MGNRELQHSNLIYKPSDRLEKHAHTDSPQQQTVVYSPLCEHPMVPGLYFGA